MVDIHSHVVWGLDDGATDMEQSLAMLRAAADSGTTDIVATPHSNAEFRYQAEAADARIGSFTSGFDHRRFSLLFSDYQTNRLKRHLLHFLEATHVA